MKKQILRLYIVDRLRPSYIKEKLKEESFSSTRRGNLKFIKCFKRHRTTARLPGSGRPLSSTSVVCKIVEHQMRKDDETTASQLHALLVQKDYRMSIKTVLHCRQSLGWIFHGSSYCQLIREVNKVILLYDGSCNAITLHIVI